MHKYRGANLIRPGFIGLVLIVLVIAIGLQPQQLLSWATSVKYQALFSEAGGLAVGNDVTVSGMKVGSVSNVALDNGDALVTFTLNSKVQLGSESTAHIRTGTLLGERLVTLESAGTSVLRPNAVIPVSRTFSPYSLTDAISNLTANSAETSTQSLNQSLDTLSATLDQIAPQLGPAFDGLTRLSQSLNSRNESLGGLLRSAANISGILSERSQQINALLLNSDDLLGVMVQRRNAISTLLANTAAVANNLSGLVLDNEQQLSPALDHMNSVMGMLEKNRDTIAEMLPGLSKYILTEGETVANGAYYTAYVPNLIVPQIMLQPFMDYAFGFRRGVNAGQPPDNAGPRFEFPWMVNGIPQPGDLPPRGGR